MAAERISSRSGRPRAKRRGSMRAQRGVSEVIATQVRERRVRLGLTQSDLAGLSNTGVRFIIDVEHGKPTIALGKLVDVLLALGLTLHVDSIQRSAS